MCVDDQLNKVVEVKGREELLRQVRDQEETVLVEEGLIVGVTLCEHHVAHVN